VSAGVWRGNHHAAAGEAGWSRLAGPRFPAARDARREMLRLHDDQPAGLSKHRRGKKLSLFEPFKLHRQTPPFQGIAEQNIAWWGVSVVGLTELPPAPSRDPFEKHGKVVTGRIKKTSVVELIAWRRAGSASR